MGNETELLVILLKGQQGILEVASDKCAILVHIVIVYRIGDYWLLSSWENMLMVRIGMVARAI